MATSVTVLMGGWSSEREVSLVSGKHVAEALTEAGYDVRSHDLRRDIPALIRLSVMSSVINVTPSSVVNMAADAEPAHPE